MPANSVRLPSRRARGWSARCQLSRRGHRCSEVRHLPSGAIRLASGEFGLKRSSFADALLTFAQAISESGEVRASPRPRASASQQMSLVTDPSTLNLCVVRFRSLLNI